MEIVGFYELMALGEVFGVWPILGTVQVVLTFYVLTQVMGRAVLHLDDLFWVLHRERQPLSPFDTPPGPPWKLKSVLHHPILMVLSLKAFLLALAWSYVHVLMASSYRWGDLIGAPFAVLGREAQSTISLGCLGFLFLAALNQRRFSRLEDKREELYELVVQKNRMANAQGTSGWSLVQWVRIEGDDSDLAKSAKQTLVDHLLSILFCEHPLITFCVFCTGHLVASMYWNLGV